MNWHIISALLAGIFSFLLGLFVYFKNKKNILNRSFFIMNIAIAVWNLADISIILSPNNVTALFFDRIAYIGAFFMMPFFVKIIFLFTESYTKPFFKKFFIYILGSAIFLSILNFTPFFIQSVTAHPFKEEIGPLYFLFIVYFTIASLFTLYQLLCFYFKTKSYFKKNQIKYIFLGLGIGVLAVYFYFITLVNPKIPPIHYFLEIIYLSVFAYAIIRYHLMDINIIIKRSTFYGLMIIFVTGTYISVIFFFENILKGSIGYYSLLSRIFAAFIIAITFLPIRNRLEKIIDKLFFRDKYEYLKSLHDLSQSLVTILDLRELMGTIVKNISQIMKVEKICLLFQDEETKNYQVKAYVGFDNRVRKRKLYNKSKLINWLRDEKKTVVKNILIEKNINNGFSNIINQIERFEAEIVMPLFFNKQLIGILSLGQKRSGDIYSVEDINLLESISNQASIAFANAKSYDDLKKTYLGTIEAFIKTIEEKDKYTWGHSERVVKYALLIAIEMDVSREKIELLKYAGFLHDIGKIVIDKFILNKPDSLTKEEFDEIKLHPVVGRDIVTQVKFLRDVGTIILHHHEKWDGTGYPDGISKEAIPLLSRILCVVDAFDAMTSYRPYRPQFSLKEAITEIEQNSGSQFDPLVVGFFIRIISQNIDNFNL